MHPCSCPLCPCRCFCRQLQSLCISPAVLTQEASLSTCLPPRAVYHMKQLLPMKYALQLQSDAMPLGCGLKSAEQSAIKRVSPSHQGRANSTAMAELMQALRQAVLTVLSPLQGCVCAWRCASARRGGGACVSAGGASKGTAARSGPACGVRGLAHLTHTTTCPPVWSATAWSGVAPPPRAHHAHWGAARTEGGAGAHAHLPRPTRTHPHTHSLTHTPCTPPGQKYHSVGSPRMVSPDLSSLSQFEDCCM